MKAGLTVLVAVATASVNTHVKVETVNFDEDQLNTENIVETSVWKKEETDKTDKPQEPEETKPEETKTEAGIDVTFKVDTCTENEYETSCSGELTMQSEGNLNDIESLDLGPVETLLVGLPSLGAGVYIDLDQWLEGSSGKGKETTEENKIAKNIVEKMQNIAQNKETSDSIGWKISETMLNEGELMKRTLNIIELVKEKKLIE